jgi:hypothetical protein
MVAIIVTKIIFERLNNSSRFVRMGAWYKVVKMTGRGRKYLYMQRTYRVPGRKTPITESYSLGRINDGNRIRQRRNAVGQVAMAVFGVEDEFGQQVDSLWNRYVNKEPAKEEAAHEERPEAEGAGAGNSEPSE